MADFIVLGFKITADTDCSLEIKRHLLLEEKAMANLDSVLKGHHFADKGLYSQGCGFSSNHVQMWKLDHKEDWVLKNWSSELCAEVDSWESVALQGDQTSQS